MTLEQSLVNDARLAGAILADEDLAVQLLRRAQNVELANNGGTREDADRIVRQRLEDPAQRDVLIDAFRNDTPAAFVDERRVVGTDRLARYKAAIRQMGQGAADARHVARAMERRR